MHDCEFNLSRLGPYDIKFLQSLHSITCLILCLVGRLFKTFAIGSVPCKPSLLQKIDVRGAHYFDVMVAKFNINNVHTCSQTAVLLPNPSAVDF